MAMLHVPLKVLPAVTTILWTVNLILMLHLYVCCLYMINAYSLSMFMNLASSEMAEYLPRT